MPRSGSMLRAVSFDENEMCGDRWDRLLRPSSLIFSIDPSFGLVFVANLPSSIFLLLSLIFLLYLTVYLIIF
jgi:hypothetical protein